MLMLLADKPPIDDRSTAVLKLSPRAKELASSLKEASGGVPKERVLERLLEWLSGQPKPFQTALLKDVGDPTTELIRIRLAAAGGDINALPFKDAASISKAAQSAIDLLRVLAEEHEKTIAATLKVRKERSS